jgi:acyl-CoA reductase-like NAD-dependent aldehyde dehydrogenase
MAFSLRAAIHSYDKQHHAQARHERALGVRAGRVNARKGTAMVERRLWKASGAYRSGYARGWNEVLHPRTPKGMGRLSGKFRRK